MKRLYIAIVACLVMVFALSVSAKSLTILNINKGELPDDSSGCDASLSEENTAKEGDFSLKLEFTKNGWCGMFQPKKGTWTGYKKIRFILVNAGDKPVTDVGFCMKGARSGGGPDNRKDYKFEIPVGKKEFSFTFYGDMCNDGKSPIDMSKVSIWNFDNYVDQKAEFFVQKVWVED